MSYNPQVWKELDQRNPLQVGVSAFLPIASAPVPALPPLLSDGFYFFEATDLCSSAGSPMTLFDIDTTSPSRHRCSPLPESSKSQGHCETVSGTSSFSPPLLSADSVPSSPSTTSIDQLPDIETEDKLRVHLDQHIRSTGWFQGGEHEPTVGAPGVPKWAAQLASHGRSIYECFVKTAREKGKPVYKCSSRGCKFKSTRLRRVVGHQRKKRNHKPFVCKAHPNWYVLAAVIRTNNAD